MLTDYKIPSRTHHDDGSWTVRYVVYEGEITTEDEIRDGERVSVTRYRRQAKLRDVTLTFPPMTERELTRQLNIRLGKSRTRTPIIEQRNG